jgi:hypothetical protein
VERFYYDCGVLFVCIKQMSAQQQKRRLAAAYSLPLSRRT